MMSEFGGEGAACGEVLGERVDLRPLVEEWPEKVEWVGEVGKEDGEGEDLLWGEGW